MRKILMILAAVLAAGAAAAQEYSLSSVPDSLLYSDAFLDTVKIKKHIKINDYILVGVNYGVSFDMTLFNPAKQNQGWLMQPNYVSVTFTKYSKLFDILPYCGFVTGLAYGHEGYVFNPNDETGYIQDVDGASRCSMDVIEVPFMTQIHIDANMLKFMGNVGVYGGYRRSVTRSGAGLDPAYADKFRDYEHRIDYGLQGGVGVALMFDPVEIHFNCLVRWGWSSLYDADYYSQYYYRFANPFGIMATAGVHFQLTKRTGNTTKQLKIKAKEKVYGTSEDSSR